MKSLSRFALLLAAALPLAGLMADAGAAAGAAAPSSGQAQKIRPGLWEHRMTLRSESGQLEGMMGMAQAQLDMMSPEQRQQVEQMMAAQGIALGGGRLDTVRVCITPEQAAHDELPQNENCQQQSMTRSGNTVRFKFSCQTNPPASGEGQITLNGPTGYTGRAMIDTELQGSPQRINADLRGTWLAADCGTVAPAGGR